MKKTISLLISFILYSSFVIAVSPNFEATVTPLSMQSGCGGCNTYFCTGKVNIVIQNKNSACGIEYCQIWYGDKTEPAILNNIAAGTSKDITINEQIKASNPSISDIRVVCVEKSSVIPYCTGEYNGKTYSVSFNNVKYCGDGDCQSYCYENCHDCYQDCVCKISEQCISVNGVYQCKSLCGDGDIDDGRYGGIDAGEECDGSNLDGKTCKTFGYDYGNLKCTSICSFDKSDCEYCIDECSTSGSVCDGNAKKSCLTDSNGCKYWGPKTFCTSDETCSNGQCISINTDENCGSIGHRCASNEKCENKVCVPLCGNGIKDPDENCYNCYEDSPCPHGRAACSPSGVCVDLDSKENCGYIGNNCGEGFCDQRKCVECLRNNDCKSKEITIQTGEYKCISEKQRQEIMLRKGGECINGKCSGETREMGRIESCYPMVCVNGECKYGVLKLNDPCDNNEQCQSGICHKGSCQSGVSIKLGTQLSSLKVGEEMDVDLSIINTIDEDIQVQLIMMKDSGMSLSWAQGAGSCSLSQCEVFNDLVSRGQKSIQLRIGALESGNKELKGKALFQFNNKQKESEQLIQKITFYECGDGKCDSNYGENEDNCKADCKAKLTSGLDGEQENKLKTGFSFKAIWSWIRKIFAR